MRLDGVQPFSLTIPGLAGAAVSRVAWLAIERHLIRERRWLRDRVARFLSWLESDAGRRAAPQRQQREFALLRLQFNTTLDQLDIFADALTQRSEHGTGVWMAGLDAVAADALTIPEPPFETSPVITYLDRGHGAAIRRARTRLPGGSLNPVALIRVPRERMVGSGIASSLVHEVGHQAAALLGLVESLRAVLRRRVAESNQDRPAWLLWERWVSEIIADFWSVAKLGVTATLGLIGVVSLPRAFVFRVAIDDPHPFPWFRVRLSCAFGGVLFPDPQWRRLERLWNSFYPLAEISSPKRQLLALLEQTMPAFVQLLMDHRPRALTGRVLPEVLPVAERQPGRLRRLFTAWQQRPILMCTSAPTLVLAVLGQGRLDGRLTPRHESATLTELLTQWAVRQAIPQTGTELECSRRIRLPRSLGLPGPMASKPMTGILQTTGATV